MADNQITCLADLKPGDIGLGPISGLVGVGVGVGELLVDGGFRVGSLDVRHALIVTRPALYRPGPMAVQAMPGGAEEITLDPVAHWSQRWAYVRIPQDYRGQAGDAARIARLMADKKIPYSPASYLALAAWRWHVSTPRLERWIDRRRPPIRVPGYIGPKFGTELEQVPAMARLPCEAICSVLVDQAWSLAGKRILEGVPHQCVTPSQLAQRLLTMPGAVWGGPAWTR
jgi:hypothetical protein